MSSVVWVVVILFGMAAITAAFVRHQAVGGPIDAAAYALPDGTIPVICLTDDGHGPAAPAPHGEAKPCKACPVCAPFVPVRHQVVGVPVESVAAAWVQTGLTAFLVDIAIGVPAVRGPPARILGPSHSVA